MTFNVAALSHLIARQLEVETTRVTDRARFVEDLGADVIQLTDLMLAIEEHFDVDISGDEVERLCTLDEVLHYLAQRGHRAVADN